MEETVIHRAVERQATIRPDVPAVTDGPRTLTYRELNLRANVVARHLVERGLRRGRPAIVRMDRSADLAITLLAVLKAGGFYQWIDPAASDMDMPAGVTIVEAETEDTQMGRWVDVSAPLSQPIQGAAPNLPIVSRGHDIACALPSFNGSPLVLVPHATIAGLPVRTFSPTPWDSDPAAFDLWVSLAAGASVSIVSTSFAAA